VLKLMAELVQNRSQRLHFDVSSPNGILLFRVTSEMIVAYGMKVNDSSSLGKCVIFAAALPVLTRTRERNLVTRTPVFDRGPNAIYDQACDALNLIKNQNQEILVPV